MPGTCSEISVDAVAICDLLCKSEGLRVASCLQLSCVGRSLDMLPEHTMASTKLRSWSLSVPEAACDLLESVGLKIFFF